MCANTLTALTNRRESPTSTGCSYFTTARRISQPRRIAGFDLNSLPVAVEFVDPLQENAAVVLKKCLEKLGVPAEVSVLIDDILSLSYYMQLAANNPAALNGDNPTFDGIDVVIQTINHIVAVGGTFSSPWSEMPPRPGTLLSMSEPPKVMVRK